MKELDNLIENTFSKRKKDTGFNFRDLLNIVSEVMDAGIPSTLVEREMRDGEKFEYFLPTIKITEDWGKPGSKDREIIETFTKNIRGNTVEEKLASINQVMSQADPGAGIPEILSAMMVTEILNAILSEFTESAGGFIFEGFLAGLFGGESVQITDVGQQEGGEAKGKPITDVELGGKEYSLKLLGPGTAVKGSFKNMVEHFAGGRDHVIYLDARRTGSGLEFSEFLITLENFAEIFIDPLVKEVTRKGKEAYTTDDPSEFKKKLSELVANKRAIKKIQFGKKGFIPGRTIRSFEFSPTRELGIQLNEAPVSDTEMNQVIGKIFKTPDEQLQELAPFTIDYADVKYEGTKAERLFGPYGVAEQVRRLSEEGDTEKLLQVLKETPGYKNSEQFEFTKNQVESIKNFKKIGELEINPEELKKTWLTYGNLLNKTVEPIYRALNLFTDNINKFFLAAPEDQDRKEFGQKAARESIVLKDTTDEAVKSS